jgi:hypothetical protein
MEMENDVKTWNVRAYVEYDIEASDSEEAIERFGECILHDLGDNGDVRDIAEVHAEKISEGPIIEDNALPYQQNENDKSEGFQNQSKGNPQSKHLNKSRGEYSVNQEIIDEVHITLADLKSGAEIIQFLQETEPVFMKEVNNFIHLELSKIKQEFSEGNISYVSSVIGAAYLCGFLIARKAAHKTYDDLLNIGSPIEKIMAQAKYLVDKERVDGRSLPEIMGNLFTKFIKESEVNMRKKEEKRKKGKKKKRQQKK